MIKIIFPHERNKIKLGDKFIELSNPCYPNKQNIITSNTKYYYYSETANGATRGDWK